MVIYIEDKKQKAIISSTILNDLPDWFGLPESTAEYIKCSQELPFWAEIENNIIKGLFSKRFFNQFNILFKNFFYKCKYPVTIFFVFSNFS